ncbi:MAG: helix-turn-helix domain-containing protein [Bacillota bacterium]
MNRLLKLKEAREILNVSEATMYTIVAKREQNGFPCLKVGGCWRVIRRTA